mmetsp:Transcript_3160/g.7395  ORF Transcript_3160/g.7395 Transcript_3160/m.7395 type:complete len:237 (+) Transcript_3160:3033-3743(+)
MGCSHVSSYVNAFTRTEERIVSSKPAGGRAIFVLPRCTCRTTGISISIFCPSGTIAKSVAAPISNTTLFCSSFSWCRCGTKAGGFLNTCFRSANVISATCFLCAVAFAATLSPMCRPCACAWKSDTRALSSTACTFWLPTEAASSCCSATRRDRSFSRGIFFAVRCLHASMRYSARVFFSPFTELFACSGSSLQASWSCGARSTCRSASIFLRRASTTSYTSEGRSSYKSTACRCR